MPKHKVLGRGSNSRQLHSGISMGMAVYSLRIRNLFLSALFIRAIKPSILCPDLHDILYTLKHMQVWGHWPRLVYISICHFCLLRNKDTTYYVLVYTRVSHLCIWRHIRCIYTWTLCSNRSLTDHGRLSKLITLLSWWKESVFDDTCHFKSENWTF